MEWAAFTPVDLADAAVALKLARLVLQQRRRPLPGLRLHVGRVERRRGVVARRAGRRLGIRRRRCSACARPRQVTTGSAQQTSWYVWSRAHAFCCGAGDHGDAGLCAGACLCHGLRIRPPLHGAPPGAPYAQLYNVLENACMASWLQTWAARLYAGLRPGSIAPYCSQLSCAMQRCSGLTCLDGGRRWC